MKVRSTRVSLTHQRRTRSAPCAPRLTSARVCPSARRDAQRAPLHPRHRGVALGPGPHPGRLPAQPRRRSAAGARDAGQGARPALAPSEAHGAGERAAPLRRRAPRRRLPRGAPAGRRLRQRHRSVREVGPADVTARHRAARVRHRRPAARAHEVAPAHRAPRRRRRRPLSAEPRRLRRVGGPAEGPAAHGPLLPAHAPAPRPAARRQGEARRRPVELRHREPPARARRGGAAHSLVRARRAHPQGDALGAARGRVGPARRRLRLASDPRPGAAVARALRRHPAGVLRALRRRDPQRRAVPLSLAALGAAQPGPLAARRGGARGRREVPARGGDARQRRRLHSPGHRLARVHPRRVLAADARAAQRQPAGREAPVARLLLGTRSAPSCSACGRR